MYNNTEKLLLIQTSLIVKLLSYGKRNTKNQIYLRRKRTDISCRLPNNLSVCKIPPTEIFFSTLSQSFPSQYLLPLVRPSFISFLLYHCRNRTSESSDFHKVQWTAPAINWFTQTSGYPSNERFPAGLDTTRFISNTKNTRLNQTENVSISECVNHRHFRFRFQYSNCLWKSRVRH